jgi:hypothetical protein
MGKPNERQVAMLTDWGIAVPPTEQSAKSLLSFVFRGNNTIGENEFARREILRKAQARWLGKHVRVSFFGTLDYKGTVLYLRAKWPTEVVNQQESVKDSYGVDAKAVLPFKARIKPDGEGKATTEVSMGQVELLDEA